MDSPPTGSDKLLELKTDGLTVVIKSKKSSPKLLGEHLLRQPSQVRVTGVNLKSIRILGKEYASQEPGAVGASSYTIHTPPLFFEQTDYEVVIKSEAHKSVSLWHEQPGIRGKITPVTDSDDLLSGILNFGNEAGFSEFEIFHEGTKALAFRMEVFPSKISYKEDYQAMLEDISNEISGAVLDFMGKTYQEFSIGSTQSTVPALFFQLLRQLFDKFEIAAATILAAPHHKLYVEHPVVPAHKVKKIDGQTIRYLQKHPEYVVATKNGYSAVKAPTVKKQITYNTAENQFTKFMIQSTLGRLKDFRQRYSGTKEPDTVVLQQVDTMMGALNKHLTGSFLREVGAYKASASMSLVFEMAPGYRELYKYYLLLQRGLAVHGDVFRMSLKDTAQLYEYWCFIKLVSLLKRKYHLTSPDVIRVENTGVTVSLKKGAPSRVRFVNPRTGETITLTYNPGEQHTQTVNQKPDNVLSLEKKGTEIPYKYVFDAKYRIETDPSSPYYPDSKPGPKVDDINTMHRYRDAIVYESDTPSRFLFEKTMFGAYVLFPYDDPDGEYQNHRFYKSIETVNVGGLPFLPGNTELVERFLTELVEDSSESAFERASLPRGIERKLKKVDWSVRDVMVGTVRTEEQLQFNLAHRGYYVPAKYISDQNFPISWIALHEQEIGNEPGIKRYGQVLTVQKLFRKRIPVTMRPGGDPNELYYYFTVRRWEELKKPIAIQDSFRGKPRFTNRFLLEHCTKSYQLFAISSEEEYRLMVEINKAFDHLTAAQEDETTVYRIHQDRSVIVADGCFTITNAKGEILDEISVSQFARRPRAGFQRIKRVVEAKPG